MPSEYGKFSLKKKKSTKFDYFTVEGLSVMNGGSPWEHNVRLIEPHPSSQGDCVHYSVFVVAASRHNPRVLH